MTGFITRSCREANEYEVIIQTDSMEHYKAAQDFARLLIDHAKPMTNADRIRAMSDEELALFLSEWGERSLAWHSEYGETLGYLQEPAKEEA